MKSEKSKTGNGLRRFSKAVGTGNEKEFPVMKAQCSTCAFTTDEQGRLVYPEVAASIQERILSDVSLLCHHPRHHGRKETHLCRGARNFQQMIFYRLGLIEAPTDEAWEKKQRELKERDKSGFA